MIPEDAIEIDGTWCGPFIPPRRILVDDIEDGIFVPRMETGSRHTGTSPFLLPGIRAATGATQRLGCPACGDAPPQGARYCIACGASLAGGG